MVSQFVALKVAAEHGEWLVKKGEGIFCQLRSDIMMGRLQSGTRLPSGIKLAEQYHVAHLTIRRVLERLQREGLLDVCHGRGIFVRNLSAYKEVTIVTNYLTDQDAMFPRPLQMALSSSGYVLTVTDIRHLIMHPEYWSYLLTKKCDWLLFDASCEFPMEMLSKFPKSVRKVAFYCFEHSHKQYPCEYVLSDCVTAGYEAAGALLACGKRRLALIGEAATPPHAQYGTNYEYLCGVKKRLAEEGLELVHTDFSGHLDDSTIQDWLSGDKRCDGIISTIDYLLMPFGLQAEALGLRIPDDLGLVGRCDTPHSRRPGYASIDVRPQEIVDKLVAAMRGKAPIRLTVAPTMIYRPSCPKPCGKTSRN